jgi:dTDP-4-dehydrorhamnose 3,5-epimerase
MPEFNAQAKARYAKQDYSAKRRIEGVEIVELKRFNDDGGAMTELGRLDGGIHKQLPGFTVRQVNYSVLEPLAIKAFHLHTRQTDVWYVPPSDKLLLVLADVRQGSPTEGQVMRFVLGDGAITGVVTCRLQPAGRHGLIHGKAKAGSEELPGRAVVAEHLDRAVLSVLEHIKAEPDEPGSVIGRQQRNREQAQTLAGGCRFGQHARRHGCRRRGISRRARDPQSDGGGGEQAEAGESEDRGAGAKRHVPGYNACARPIYLLTANVCLQTS